MPEVTRESVLAALLTFDTFDPGRNYGCEVVWEIAQVLDPEDNTRSLRRQVRIALDRMSPPPPVTADVIFQTIHDALHGIAFRHWDLRDEILSAFERAGPSGSRVPDEIPGLISLARPERRWIALVLFSNMMGLLMERSEYPYYHVLEKVVRAQLGRLGIKVEPLPHVTAKDTLSAMDELSEDFLRWGSPYVSVEHIAWKLAGRFGVRVTDELKDIVKLHILRNRRRVREIKHPPVRIFDWEDEDGTKDYCTEAFLRTNRVVDPDDPA